MISAVQQFPFFEQCLLSSDRVRFEQLVRLSEAAVYSGPEFVLADDALVPICFIFDSVLRNSAVDGQQPNDSVLTLRLAIDPGCGEEFNSLLGAVSVDEQANIAL
jgi:hypothetical protein